MALTWAAAALRPAADAVGQQALAAGGRVGVELVAQGDRAPKGLGGLAEGGEGHVVVRRQRAVLALRRLDSRERQFAQRSCQRQVDLGRLAQDPHMPRRALGGGHGACRHGGAVDIGVDGRGRVLEGAVEHGERL